MQAYSILLHLILMYWPVLFYSLQIYWSENGELVCISTDESFFILKYKQESVDQAAEDKELVTEDGIEEAFDVSNTRLLARKRFTEIVLSFPMAQSVNHWTYMWEVLGLNPEQVKFFVAKYLTLKLWIG